MNIELNYRIKSNPNYLKYLRTHSYWYKYLNRSSLYFKPFIGELKKEYKLTVEDKMNKMASGIDAVSKIMDILN